MVTGERIVSMWDASTGLIQELHVKEARRMSRKLTRREMLKLTAGLAAGALLASCGADPTEAPPTVISWGDRQAEKAIVNPTDIVTPYFEEMFNFKLDIAVPPEGHTMEEMFALRAAAGDVPDIF